jgi:DNA-binding MarR family transcriptional regulator
VAYFAYGILSFITIIGIPAGIVYVRMGQFLLFPVGARVVTKKQAYASAAANEMEKRGLVGKGISASQQNITVNVGQIPAEKESPEKQILKITQTNQVLTLGQIVSQTNLEIEEAETTIKKLVDKGLAKEDVGPDGKTRYDFS